MIAVGCQDGILARQCAFYTDCLRACKQSPLKCSSGLKCGGATPTLILHLSLTLAILELGLHFDVNDKIVTKSVDRHKVKTLLINAAQLLKIRSLQNTSNILKFANS